MDQSLNNAPGITPPPELVEQWELGATLDRKTGSAWTQAFATRAAQWGADQELEACCAVLDGLGYEETITSDQLHAARRPKPPSLKELALEGLTRIESTNDFFSNQMKDLATIRRALEQLDA